MLLFTDWNVVEASFCEWQILKKLINLKVNIFGRSLWNIKICPINPVYDILAMKMKLEKVKFIKNSDLNHAQDEKSLNLVYKGMGRPH